MYNEANIAALVPMRHHSERVPGKNYRDFAGKPLFHHILQTLSDCKLISKIVVNTDSPDIITGVKHAFPHVHLIERPSELCAGTVPMNDILLYDVQHVKADFYLQTHSTNPLLQSQTVEQAVEQFLTNYPMYDSLFGVTRLQTRLWNQVAMPLNHNPNILMRTQDLPPVYEENSNIYIFTREALQRKHNRIGDRPLLFEIDRLEAWDIDEEIDFQVAQNLYKLRHKD
jgi:CMP-N-acetylneuraminic acid synthetase